MNQYKRLFLLDPQVIFLNHGSFGACPKSVFEAYQEWQQRLEKQPVLFLGREYNRLMQEARQALGRYLHCDADDLAFIPNATHGVNIVARSLCFGPGDEVLTSNHEYGACDNTWEFICQKTGARYIHCPLPLPLTSGDELVDALWKGVNERTRLIYLSHITSPTAQLFPVEKICQRAHERGILTAIDGAHAPGQLELDLGRIGTDFYFGNCHKWMLSPKGAAFIYVRREHQSIIEPLVVSWGWGANYDNTTGSRFIDFLQWSGTYDPSASLAVPDAIRFMEDNNWPLVRQRCHALLIEALKGASAVTGMPIPYLLDDPEQSFLPTQMGITALPDHVDAKVLKETLYNRYHIEIPYTEWNGQKYLRISIQGYNDETDVEVLLKAMKREIKPLRS